MGKYWQNARNELVGVSMGNITSLFSIDAGLSPQALVLADTSN